jgi:hypothetical protein
VDQGVRVGGLCVAARTITPPRNGRTRRSQFAKKARREEHPCEILSVSLQKGRPARSTGYVQLRSAVVAVWEERMITRFTTYNDIDEARAAAVRLAEERG